MKTDKAQSIHHLHMVKKNVIHVVYPSYRKVWSYGLKYMLPSTDFIPCNMVWLFRKKSLFAMTESVMYFRNIYENGEAKDDFVYWT